MKKTFTSFLLCLTTLAGLAQVPKKVVAEHFTNTLCSICASRNPGFYTNLAAQTNVLHLAVHPSAPYAACVLNLHNKPENDARTNYYSVYGGTPRIVIQGSVIPSSANYSSASMFSPFLGQTSPASIKVIQKKYGNDSIRSRIVIKTEATHALGNLRLFVALAEDTLNYSAPNGEALHHDVFRKSYTGTSGVLVNLPATVGDSVVYTNVSLVNGAWNFSRIYTLAILQEEGNKAVVQCESASAKSGIITGLKNTSYDDELAVNVFPNPSTDKLTVVIKDGTTAEVKLFNELGEEVYAGKVSGKSEIDLKQLTPGFYVVRLENETGNAYKTIIKN